MNTYAYKLKPTKPTKPTNPGLERFDTWDHISLQGVNLDVPLVMQNVLFIEPQMLFLGK